MQTSFAKVQTLKVQLVNLIGGVVEKALPDVLTRLVSDVVFTLAGEVQLANVIALCEHAANIHTTDVSELLVL